MNFRGHFIGGIAAASGVSLLGAGLFGAFSTSSLTDISSVSAAIEANGLLPFLVLGFCITLFMSLFPDLDIGSTPQRWFYRLVFLGLIILILLDKYEWSGLVGLMAVTPLLHKHRGWTHWKLTPWFMALFFILLYKITKDHYFWKGRLSIQYLSDIIQNSWFIILAFVAGHYTHLILDKLKPL